MLHSRCEPTLRNMKVKAHLSKLMWLLPFALYSAEANAWGLVTHLYFAQSLLWAMPLLDPRLQKAIKQFPELVMAGACLPDLAIVSNAFRHTHHWENAHHLLVSAESDEELAIAIGYASHLYVDVIAHNHFVPAHEAMWLQNSMLTHIASEWAMDAHLSPLMDTSPGKVLNKHRKTLIKFIAPRFRCSETRANIGLQRLAFWDNMLRFVRLPHVIYGCVRLADSRTFKHFTYYIAKTQTAISNIGLVLNGYRPDFEPELKHLSIDEMIEWRKECLSNLKLQHPSPIKYFDELLRS